MLTLPALRRLLCGLVLALSPATGARGCDVALVLAVDVSGSVDAWEYQLQMQGIAGALRDPEVHAALLRGRVAVSLLQWSGAAEQTVAIPFTRLDEPAAITRLAARIGGLPRAHTGGNTAVGEAIRASAALFDAVPDCAHWVIDVSGDGDENDGFSLPRERRAAWRRGITINGLAIEGVATGQSVTNFYRRHVITPGGFVITAAQHQDFARAMREKLLRELVAPLALAPGGGEASPDFLHPQIRSRLFFAPESPMLTLNGPDPWGSRRGMR